jgi:hypothetical protein
VKRHLAPRLAEIDVVTPSASLRSANRIEIALGRTAAACVHPLAAWHDARRTFRVLLVAGYFAAGFVAALAALILN